LPSTERDSYRRGKLPKHRPGEPWLRPYVLEFAKHLRSRGQSWRRTLGTIAAAFEAVGMGDIVTPDKVRHIIRQKRKEDATFGNATSGLLCLYCGPGPTGIGRALELRRGHQKGKRA